MHTQKELEAIRDKNQDWLCKIAGINGVGVGLASEGGICLAILTNGLKDLDRKGIVEKLGEIPHEFIETGEFKNLSSQLPESCDGD